MDHALAALTVLLRPKLPPQRKLEVCSDDTTGGAAADQLARIATDTPPYPVVEVHALMDRQDWTGQPTGKTVRVGNASPAEWQASDNRGRVGTRERAKQSRAAGPGRRHQNASKLRYCLEGYRRQTKGTDEQYRGETLVCRKPEEGAGNEQEAPGASHTAGSESSYTAGTGAPAVIHQGSDRSDQMMRSQDSNNSYELDPAGTELCITADISRTYLGPWGYAKARVGAGFALVRDSVCRSAVKRAPGVTVGRIAREGVRTRAGPEQ